MFLLGGREATSEGGNKGLNERVREGERERKRKKKREREREKGEREM